MITTFRFNYQNKQLYVTTKDGKLYYIPLKSFAKYIPFPWDGNLDIFDYPSLKGLFIDILNEIWTDAPDLLKLKFFNVSFEQNGKRCNYRYNNFMDARTAYVTAFKNPHLYQNIHTDFNPEIQ